MRLLGLNFGGWPMVVDMFAWRKGRELDPATLDPPVACYHCGKGHLAPGRRCCYCNEPYEWHESVMEYDSVFHGDGPMGHLGRSIGYTPRVYVLTPMRYVRLLCFLHGGWMPPWVSVWDERRTKSSLRFLRARRRDSAETLSVEDVNDETE